MFISVNVFNWGNGVTEYKSQSQALWLLLGSHKLFLFTELSIFVHKNRFYLETSGLQKDNFQYLLEGWRTKMFSEFLLLIQTYCVIIEPQDRP